jgi:hypothetical protein
MVPVGGQPGVVVAVADDATRSGERHVGGGDQRLLLGGLGKKRSRIARAATAGRLRTSPAGRAVAVPAGTAASGAARSEPASRRRVSWIMDVSSVG